MSTDKHDPEAFAAGYLKGHTDGTEGREQTPLTLDDVKAMSTEEIMGRMAEVDAVLRESR